MTARELLNELKQQMETTSGTTSAGIVAMLTGDPLLIRLVACWSLVPLGPDPNPTEVMPEETPPTHRLRWLWARVEPDPTAAWLETAGLPDAPHFRRRCDMARLTRMVFPDGTLSTGARVFLQQTAAQMLGVGRQAQQRAVLPLPPPAAP